MMISIMRHISFLIFSRSNMKSESRSSLTQLKPRGLKLKSTAASTVDKSKLDEGSVEKDTPKANHPHVMSKSNADFRDFYK